MKTIKILMISDNVAEIMTLTKYCSEITNWTIVVDHQAKDQEFSTDSDLIIIDKAHDTQLESLIRLRQSGDSRPVIVMIDDLGDSSTTVAHVLEDDDIDAFKRIGADDWIAKSRVSSKSLKRAIYNVMEHCRLRQMLSNALGDIKHIYETNQQKCQECRDQIFHSLRTIRQAIEILSRMEHNTKQLEYLEVIKYCCIQIEARLRKEMA